MSEDPKHLPATTTPSDANTAARQRLLWAAVILLLMGLLGLALFNAWQWQQRQALEQELTQSLEQGLERVSKVAEDLKSQRQAVDSQISDRLRRLESNVETQSERQQGLERRLDQASRSLLQMGKRTRNDWLLAEAEYLIRIANQRLQMERDISGALSLLQSADEVLRETDDMGVYPVRQELAEDIQALKSVEDVDRVGLYLQLEAAIARVGSLAEANLAATTPLDTAAPAGKEPKDGAKGPIAEAWRTAKQTLSEVVAIRRLDEPVKPLLSPRQSAYANLNLRLMLEEAEMALLSANPVLYRRSLNKAVEWLRQWYDKSNKEVSGLIQTLESLAEREIKPELPDISESLKLLKARINGQISSDAETPQKEAETPQKQDSQGEQPES